MCVLLFLYDATDKSQGKLLLEKMITHSPVVQSGLPIVRMPVLLALHRINQFQTVSNLKRQNTYGMQA